MRERFDSYFNEVEREGKENLLKHLEECGYFTAPCSGQYHLSKKGGLVEHSLNVADIMLSLSSILDKDITIENIIITSLFHDLGKADYYNKPNYVENILKSGKISDSKPYTTNKERLSVPHEIVSVHILSKFIRLTEDETFAILYHNGLYTNIGYGLRGNERPLQTLLHFADLWASRFVEVNAKPAKNGLF